jgi:hypothetical protein
MEHLEPYKEELSYVNTARGLHYPASEQRQVCRCHEHDGEDFRLVTRPIQHDDTQLWLLRPRGGERYTIQQVSNGRYVDAHEHDGEDFRLVTRPMIQDDGTQLWLLRRHE